MTARLMSSGSHGRWVDAMAPPIFAPSRRRRSERMYQNQASIVLAKGISGTTANLRGAKDCLDIGDNSTVSAVYWLLGDFYYKIMFLVTLYIGLLSCVKE